MIICYNNYIEDATPTASSEKTGYAVSNIKIPQLARIFKFDGNSGNVIIDLGSAKEIKSIILGNTNITSSGTLTIEANISDSWTSPAYTTTITVNDDTTNQIKLLSESYRYWRLVLSDSSVTDLQIAHIFIGTYFTMPGFSVGKSEPERTTSFGQQSRTLQWYGNRGLIYKNPKFTFPILTDTEKDNITTMFHVVQNTEPIYLIAYENDLDVRPPLFCVIDSNTINFNQQHIDNFNFSMEFLEVK